MLWQRPMGSRELFHLPRKDLGCGQNWHYFQTLCRKELKCFYNHWEIVEDPPKHLCCPKCLAKLVEEE